MWHLESHDQKCMQVLSFTLLTLEGLHFFATKLMYFLPGGETTPPATPDLAFPQGAVSVVSGASPSK